MSPSPKPYVQLSVLCIFVFSSRRRHTRCALVTGVQTCALPIYEVRRAAGFVRLRRAIEPWKERGVVPTDDAGDDGFVVDILRIGIDGGEFMRRFGQVERMDAARGAQIGRASCRERVCQYV